MKNKLNNQMDFNKHGFVPAMVFLMLFGFKFQARADMLYLKNGRSIEGIIIKEDDLDVNLEIGCGVVKFSKDQIERILGSSSEGSQLIKQGWAKEKEASAARAREVQQRQEREPKQAVMDKQNGHLTVETTLNKKVKANLMLDTGSSLVVLSSKIAARLGIDVSAKSSDVVELVLADGRKVEARRIILDNVSVQGSEIEKVEAAVLPEQDNSVFTHDGLLGMSFLKKFIFKIDQKNNKLVLEKL
jgi:clan AA aspartic protease (TIGR02281 family)